MAWRAFCKPAVMWGNRSLIQHAKMGPMSRVRLTLLFLGVLAILTPVGWGSVRASAQSKTTVRLAPPTYTQFPAATLFFSVTSDAGSHLTGINASQVQVVEDGNAVSPQAVTQEDVGTRQVFVLNTNQGLGLRDTRGRTRFDFLRQALLGWWALPKASAYGLDDLSLVTGDGTLVRHSPAAAELAAALDAADPTFNPPSHGYALLLQAMNLITDPGDQTGVSHIVIFLTSLPRTPDQVALSNVIALANQTGTTIYPVLIDTAQALEAPEAQGLAHLAEQTGGQLTIFDPAAGLTDLAQMVLSQRVQYKVSYTSAINNPGAHNVQIQLTANGETLTSNTQSFQLTVEPPQVTFIEPPSQITRQPSESSQTLETIPPTQQDLKVLVTFPDNHPRPLTSAELIVDGNVVSRIDQPPFDTFHWDLTGISSSGQHTLQAQVNDSLGLQSRSLPQKVDVEVVPPPSGLLALGPALGTLLVVLGVLAAGVVLALVILSYGRRRVEPDLSSRHSQPATSRRLQRASLHQAESAAQAEAFLVPANPDQSDTATIPLVGTDISLGRDPSLSAFPLADPSVSTLHARLIRQAGGSYLIRDQGSVAGTWVNYELVPEDGRRLHHGDIVHLGRAAFRFQRPGDGELPEIIVHPGEENGSGVNPPQEVSL